MSIELTGKIFDFQLLAFEEVMADIADSSKEPLMILESRTKRIEIKRYAFVDLLDRIRDLIDANDLKKVVDDESSLDDLLGFNAKEIEFTTFIGDWTILDLISEIDKAKSKFSDDVGADDWLPPENWVNGTDDEKEAYASFWKSKQSS
jgi:hypothetical protein